MLSFRRKYLDQFLIKNKDYINNHVLDIGGKKTNKRGYFNPTKTNAILWTYLNIDKNTDPDICASVYDIPLANNSVQTIIFCEILEYLEEPKKALIEMKRVLSVNGYIVGSVPFLSPIHGDKEYDQIRYTKTGLINLFNLFGFKIIKLNEMGSTSAVIYDILRINYAYSKNIISKIFVKLLFFITPIFSLLDKSKSNKQDYINTGYFFIIKKID